MAMWIRFQLSKIVYLGGELLKVHLAPGRQPDVLEQRDVGKKVSNLSALHIEMEGNACDSSDDEAYKESNGVTEDAGLVEAMEAIVFSEEVWGQREWGENDMSHLALPDYGNDISSTGMKRQRVN